MAASDDLRQAWRSHVRIFLVGDGLLGPALEAALESREVRDFLEAKVKARKAPADQADPSELRGLSNALCLDMLLGEIDARVCALVPAPRREDVMSELKKDLTRRSRTLENLWSLDIESDGRISEIIMSGLDGGAVQSSTV